MIYFFFFLKNENLVTRVGASLSLIVLKGVEIDRLVHRDAGTLSTVYSGAGWRVRAGFHSSKFNAEIVLLVSPWTATETVNYRRVQRHASLVPRCVGIVRRVRWDAGAERS